MKNVTILALALAIVGCDSERDNPVAPNVDSVVVRDTVKKDSIVRDTIRDTVKIDSGKTIRYTIRSHKTFYDTVTKASVNDTNISVVKKSMITGSVVFKESNGGASVIVCSKGMGRCAKTNFAGVYQISKPNTIVAGRILLTTDTVQTPETINTPKNDTVIVKDTSKNIVDTVGSDTTKVTIIKISGNDTLAIDSISITDTVKVTIPADTTSVEITKYDTTKVNDTLTFISNGIILKEVPIVSWGDVLGPKYVVQRNIAVIDSITDKSIRNVEAVYFLNSDSVAKVITLGKMKDFSGFVYTLYDDSSFRNDMKIYNLFVRGKDSIGQIVSKTDIESFSERLGDISTITLSVKVGVPQWMVPAISKVPNNTGIPEFVKTYKNDGDKTYWIGIESADMRELSVESFYDLFGIVANTHNYESPIIPFEYDSLSVEIKTDDDSIQIHWERNLSNDFSKSDDTIKVVSSGKFVEYKMSIYKGTKVSFQVSDTNKIEYRNIKFRVRG